MFNKKKDEGPPPGILYENLTLWFLFRRKDRSGPVMMAGNYRCRWCSGELVLSESTTENVFAICPDCDTRPYTEGDLLFVEEPPLVSE